MKQKHSNQSGFTLIEVITATAVTGILFVVIMLFTSNSLVSTTVQSARSDLLREAQLGLDVVGTDIRLSANAEENNRWEDQHAPSAPSDLFSWVSDANTLVLATAAMDNDDDILFDDPLNYVTHKNNSVFFVENNTLYKRTLAADVSGNAAATTCPKNAATSSCLADRELMNNVVNFEVRYLSGDDEEVDPANARSVEVSVRLETTKYGRTLDAEYKTRMVFRNE